MVAGEGRYTAGYNAETGKRIIKNVLGKTQAECKAKDYLFQVILLMAIRFNAPLDEILPGARNRKPPR